MKILHTGLCGLAIFMVTAQFSYGSISDKQAKVVDGGREGNIPKLVQAYFLAHVDSEPKSCGSDFNQEPATPDYRVLRLKGSSGFDGDQLRYDSTYLVVKYCFNGVTHGGSDRSIGGNAVIQVTRIGVDDLQGGIKMTQPDQFKVLRKINPDEFAPQY